MVETCGGGGAGRRETHALGRLGRLLRLPTRCRTFGLLYLHTARAVRRSIMPSIPFIRGHLYRSTFGGSVSRSLLAAWILLYHIYIQKIYTPIVMSYHHESYKRCKAVTRPSIAESLGMKPDALRTRAFMHSPLITYTHDRSTHRLGQPPRPACHDRRLAMCVFEHST